MAKVYVIKSIYYSSQGQIDNDPVIFCRSKVFVSYTQVTENGLDRMYPSLTSQITATYRDFQEVMCPLFHIRRPGNFALNNPQNPMSLVYKVSVSNDLQTFSDQVTLMAYDGNCVECNTTDLLCGYKVPLNIFL